MKKFPREQQIKSLETPPEASGMFRPLQIESSGSLLEST